MPKGGYEWELNGQLPEVGEHSLAKHEVLYRYLVTYVDVLTSDLRMDDFRLTLIDGFAGGGRYVQEGTRQIREGSPLLMLRAMEEAEHRAQMRRQKPFVLRPQFFFIEKRKTNFLCLQNAIGDKEFANKFKAHAICRHGSFEDEAPAIIADIKRRGRAHRAIFLLDQYGWTDVPLRLMRDIMTQLPNAEILLTFSTDDLIDHLSEKPITDQSLRRTGLDGFAEQLQEILLMRRQAGRHDIQCILSRELQEGSGARFFTPFFIRSPASHRDYWLVHLSTHVRARNEMVCLHWSMQNRFMHYGAAGLNMLGYDPREDDGLTGQGNLFGFDSTAEQRTRETLLSEVPRRIASQFPGGEQFSKIFESFANEMPATRAILEKVLKECVSRQDLVLYDHSGRPRNVNVKHIHDDDIFGFSSQLRLFGSGG